MAQEIEGEKAERPIINAFSGELYDRDLVRLANELAASHRGAVAHVHSDEQDQR